MSAEDQKRQQEADRMKDKLDEANRRKMGVQSQLNQTKMFKRKAELTLKETSALEEKTITYKAVGRMFMRTPVADLTTQLEGKIKKSEESIVALTKQADYLENEVKTQTAALEEYVMDVRAQYAEQQEAAKAANASTTQ